MVELPGVKEPERVRKLLQGTASLEFWTTYENHEIYESLKKTNDFIKQIQLADQTTVQDSVATQDTTLSLLATQSDSLSMAENAQKEFPLFSVLSPSIGEQNGQQVLMPGARIGIAHYRDTAKINAWLRVPQIQLFFPIDFVPLWSVKAINEAGTDFELIAVKNTRDGKALLDGSVIIDAHHSSGPHGVTVSIKMNHEGAGKWAHMTKNEMGYCIAIVLDNVVYSYPKVMGEITGGNSQITGNFTLDEAENLVNVIKSGKLPVAMRIVEESVVVSSEGW